MSHGQMSYSNYYDRYKTDNWYKYTTKTSNAASTDFINHLRSFCGFFIVMSIRFYRIEFLALDIIYYIQCACILNLSRSMKVMKK